MRLRNVIYMAAVFPFLVHAAQEWLTIHGFPETPEEDVIEVIPTPILLESQATVQIRVSRAAMRTSFKGNRYRSYKATAVIDCKTQQGWYLKNQYHQQPLWQGPVTATEEFKQGQAPVLFRDVPGDTAAKLIAAACKANETSKESG